MWRGKLLPDSNRLCWVCHNNFPSGKFKECEYDKCGRVTRITHDYDKVEERCDEHLIKRSYDKHGFIRSLQSSLGAQLSYERNEYGELICFKANEAETNARFTSEHQYDSLGFELERLLPGGVSQSFTYDNIGRLVNSKTHRSAERRRSRHYT